MKSNFGRMAIFIASFAAILAAGRIQLIGGGDGCPEGKYCSGGASGGKCYGKCIPEDLNHSRSMAADRCIGTRLT